MMGIWWDFSWTWWRIQQTFVFIDLIRIFHPPNWGIWPSKLRNSLRNDCWLLPNDMSIGFRHVCKCIKGVWNCLIGIYRVLSKKNDAWGRTMWLTTSYILGLRIIPRISHILAGWKMVGSQQKNPKSSILIGFSMINHPCCHFGVPPIYGNPHIKTHLKSR